MIFPQNESFETKQVYIALLEIHRDNRIIHAILRHMPFFLVKTSFLEISGH